MIISFQSDAMSVGQLGGVILLLGFFEAGSGAVTSSPSHSCLPSSWEGWASTREEAEDLFYRQGDWGFLEDLREGLQEYCPGPGAGPRLQCSKHLAYCRSLHGTVNTKQMILNFILLLKT